MPVSYSDPLKTTRMQDVADAIDAAGMAGSLEICSDDYDAVLLVFELSYPAATVVDDTLTLNDLPKRRVNGVVNGKAVFARIKDGDDNIVASGLTVGIDVILSSASITVGKPYQLMSASIVHSA